jgi:hypothetical protein
MRQICEVLWVRRHRECCQWSECWLGLTLCQQIATAFIHLLAPALEALGSECLSPAWGDYVSVDLF